jgi:hypothetical protein
MALYAVVPALAAMTAAGAVYLGDNLKSTQIEAQLPSEISQIIPENLKSKSIPTEQLSIKDVDKNLEKDNSITETPTETAPESSSEPPTQPPLESPPESPPEPPTESAPEPPTEPPSEPITPSSSTPTSESQINDTNETDSTEKEIKGGGQVGRPLWGEISSSLIKKNSEYLISDSTGSTGSTGSTDLLSRANTFFSKSQTIDPVEIQRNLRKVRDLIKNKKAEIAIFTEKISDISDKRKKLLDEFSDIKSQQIVSDIIFKKAEKRLEVYKDIEKDPELSDIKEAKKRLEEKRNKDNKIQNLQQNQNQNQNQNQPKTTGGNQQVKYEDIEKLIDKANKRRKELESEIEDPEKRSKFMSEYKNAWLRKEEIDSTFKKIEEKRIKEIDSEKNEIVKLEVLKKELEELKKEEQNYLKDLLQFQPAKPQETIVADFGKRRNNYFKAKDEYEAAKTRYTNYLALDNRDSSVQNKFKNEQDYAAKELDRAIVLLTEIKSNETFASLEFSKFRREIEEILESSITDQYRPDDLGISKTVGQYTSIARTQLTDFWWGGKENGIGSFLNAFQIFLKILRDPLLAQLANIYYLTSKEQDIIDNLERYLEFFKTNSKNFYEPSLNANQSQKFENFQSAMLKAYESIRPLEMNITLNPAPATIEKYNKIREKGMQFIDKQVYSINSFLELVRSALITSKYEGSTHLTNLKELYRLTTGIMSKIILPNSGTCEQLLPKPVYELLKSGIFGKELVDGKEIELKIPKLFSDLTKLQDKRQDFFDKIGFVQIENFEQLLNYYRKNFTLQNSEGQQNTKLINLFRKAVLSEINKTTGEIPISLTLDYNNTFDKALAIDPASPIRPNELHIDLSLQPGGLNADLDGLYDKNTFERITGGRTNISDIIYLRDIKFEYGNFMKTKSGIETVKKIFDACEVDGNVGLGFFANKTLKETLEKLKDFGQEKTKKTGLDLFIDIETKSGKINPARTPVRDIIKTLGDIGFSPMNDYEVFSICKTSEKYSIIYAFLECKSKKFSSIPYDSQSIFNGVRRKSREIFVELFAEELKKTTPFRSVNKDDQPILKDFKDYKNSEQELIIVKGLALQFNINIVLFENSPKLNIKVIQPQDDRSGIEDIYMFRDKQNIYYPISLQEHQPHIFKNDDYDLSRFMGGAINAPELKFKDNEKQTIFEEKYKNVSKVLVEQKAENLERERPQRTQPPPSGGRRKYTTRNLKGLRKTLRR